MILPDVNVLIYAHNEADARFGAANRWLRELLPGPTQVAFCWETINGFVRVSTNQRLASPLKLDQALTIVRAWLNFSNAVLVHRSRRHLDILDRVATKAKSRGPLFSDAVLAAIAIEHNATLATTDSDFERFEGLKWLNPLRPTVA